MTRFAYAAAESASGATLLQYRMLVDLSVTSSTVYACTGNQFLLPGSFGITNTYSPVGGFGGIEPVEDEADGTPRTVRLWLQAVGSADLYEPLREDMFNRPVLIRRLFLYPMTDVAVSTPETLWKGFVNKVEVRFADTERGNFFEIEAESALRRKAEAMNFNVETHQTVLAQSGDTFFKHIHLVPLSKALWGSQPTSFAGVAPYFGGGRRGVIDAAFWRFRNRP